MNKDVRTITTWLLHGVHSAPPSVVDAAKRLATPSRRRPRPALAHAKPDRKAAKTQRREERNERVAKIREEAFAEWLGNCALCWGHGGGAAEDLHHVLSGPERRLRESVETVLPVCRHHHKELHHGDLETLEHARRVCHANEMPLAERSLDRRIAKLLEARSALKGAKETP